MSLDVQKLHKEFSGDDPQNGSTVALQDISFSAAKGSFISFIGPSGCGKTTMLRILSGLETATSGTVSINGVAVSSQWKYAGYVFQEYALFPWRTVIDNIAFGLDVRGVSRKERKERAMEFVEKFGLAGFEDKYPAALSGGMQQRVAIARTLINDPEIVLMDEPFGALDSQTRSLMQQFLLDVWQQSDKTVLFITHNIDEAVYLSQTVYGISSRPGTIGLTVPIDMPYPRDVTSDAFNNYRREILNFLDSQHRRT